MNNILQRWSDNIVLGRLELISKQPFVYLATITLNLLLNYKYIDTTRYLIPYYLLSLMVAALFFLLKYKIISLNFDKVKSVFIRDALIYTSILIMIFGVISATSLFLYGIFMQIRFLSIYIYALIG